MTKATAETIREAAVRNVCGRSLCWYPKCLCGVVPADADNALSTLPLTLNQLAGIANGELVLTDAKELERLKGTLRYIGTQAVSTAYASNPKLALSVIAQNVSAALNDEFQAAVRSAMLAASPEKGKTT